MENENRIEATKAMVEVMNAFSDGAKIECKVYYGKVWHDEPRPTWDWAKYDYRIKEEEKPESEMMTNGQLAELLAKGYGSMRRHYDFLETSQLRIYMCHTYRYCDENNPIDEEYEVRAFGSKEWVKATKALYDSIFSSEVD